MAVFFKIKVVFLSLLFCPWYVCIVIFIYLNFYKRGRKTKLKLLKSSNMYTHKELLLEKGKVKENIKRLRETFKCNSCLKSFYYLQNFKRHICTVHESPKDYKCKTCGKTFSMNRNLKQHIHRVHEGHKDYKCKTCGKSFSSNRNLKQHIHTVHEGHKLSKCETCGKSFTTGSYLKKYIHIVPKITNVNLVANHFLKHGI